MFKNRNINIIYKKFSYVKYNSLNKDSPLAKLTLSSMSKIFYVQIPTNIKQIFMILLST